MAGFDYRPESLKKRYPNYFRVDEEVLGCCGVRPGGTMNRTVGGAVVGQLGGAFGALGGGLGGGLQGAIEGMKPKGSCPERFPVNGIGILAITNQRVVAFGSAGVGGQPFMSEYKVDEIQSLTVSRGVVAGRLTVNFADGGALVLDVRHKEGDLKALPPALQKAKEAVKKQPPRPVVSFNCPNCHSQQQVDAATNQTTCSHCKKYIVWRRCESTNQVFPVLWEWDTWNHPGCDAKHPVKRVK